jgi:hypothetical protein
MPTPITTQGEHWTIHGRPLRRLLDHLIRPLQDRQRDRQAEGLGVFVATRSMAARIRASSPPSALMMRSTCPQLPVPKA